MIYIFRKGILVVSNKEMSGRGDQKPLRVDVVLVFEIIATIFHLLWSSLIVIQSH